MTAPIPLRRWSVRNFKALRSVDLELAPLTIVSGKNSSGKSSLIQSLLLLTQTARQNALDPAISLNGPLTTLGGPDQVRSFGVEGQAVELTGTFDGLGPRLPLRASEVRHGLVATTEWMLELTDAPEGRPGAMSIGRVEARITSPRESLSVVLHPEPRPRAEHRRAYEAGLRLTSRPTTTSPLGLVGELRTEDDPPVQALGAQTFAGFPRLLFVEDTDVNVFAREWWERHARRRSSATGTLLGVESAHFEMTREERLDALVRLALQDFAAARDDERARRPLWTSTNRRVLELLDDPDVRRGFADFEDRLAEAAEGSPVIVPLQTPAALDIAGTALRRFLTQQVAYLGPLRQDPTVLQRGGATTAAGDIGTKGEFAAAVLYANRDTEIDSPQLDGPPQRRRLETALNEWAQHLDVAEEVRAVDLGRLGIELQIRPSGIDRDIDLTNVGVGVSQLLPVLLVCLLAQPDSLVLLEQPELHLHPAMQQRLGDFLLACAGSGRQLIVETHSEHLISRLRRRAAEDHDDEIVELFKIVFAELDDTGATQLREVRANRYGGIEEWPQGFFDQGVREARAILEVGLAKKRRDEEQV